MDTSGFYTYFGELIYTPGNIFGPGWELIREIHDQYTYPIEGWYWFDSEEEAKKFFNIPNDSIDPTN